MRITSQDKKHQQIIDKVYAAGQEHVFRFWPELNDSSREQLLQQLEVIDFDLISDLKRKFIDSKDGQSHSSKLEPADFIPLPTTDAEMAAHEKAKSAGEKAIREGQVGVFLVAGGQGSRLGFDGPKGCFPVSPVKKKTLFQLHSEKILALNKRYNVTIPWYIMTSEANHKATTDFFSSHHYFGLKRDDIMFFQQEMIQALDPDGKLLLERKDSIFRSPNGHGGSLKALQVSGALHDMKKRGIDQLFYFQVDNVLVKICDPIFIGYHILEKAEMSAKIVTKVNPEEKVGVLAKSDGKLGVVEYSDMDDSKKFARNTDGTLKFRAGSPAIHVFDVAFIEKEIGGGLKLPWHVAHKKVNYLNELGAQVEPSEPNAYKFETFVFDALADVNKAAFLEVKREEEYSPVKNAAGGNSAETAQQAMSNFFGNWLEKAGIKILRDSKGDVRGRVEISPLLALDEEELKNKIPPNLMFKDPLYLDAV